MAPAPAPPPFQRGDVVACIHPTAQLEKGHLYLVRAVAPAADVLAAARGEGPWVFIDGIAQPFLAARFRLRARAANDDAACAQAREVPVRMAQIMRARLTTEGACTWDDLARAGFTTAQMIEFQDEARRLAGLVSDPLAGPLAGAPGAGPHDTGDAA